MANCHAFKTNLEMFRSYQSILQSSLVPLGPLGPLVQVGPPVRECSLRLHVVKTRHDEEENVKRLGKKTIRNMIVVIPSMLPCDYDPVAPDFGRQKTPGANKRMGHHVIFQYLLAQTPNYNDIAAAFGASGSST